jgi:hypothetical protein
MKRIVIGLTLLALLAIGAYATERVHNQYKTHRINANTVLFTCEDEHEPTVKKFENTTMVMLSCEKR